MAHITNKEALILAYKKGYRVLQNQVISPRGIIRKLQKIKSKRDRLYFSIHADCPNTFGSIPVHRLVAYQKYGDELFREGIEVRHLDNDPNNNNEENISIGNHSENMMDSLKEIRDKKAKYASSFITKHDAEAIKKDRELGMKYKDLMKKYNISSKGTMSYIVNKR